MSDDVNQARRGFLRGRVRTAPPPRRPPWALPEADFLHRCTRCAACAPVCPTRIIVLRAGYPEVDFGSAGCTFCGKCAAACVPQALLRLEGRAPWTARASVAPACLAQRGVECRVCEDRCEAAAIRFSPRINLPPAPTILDDACTGCGACVSACPAQALSVA